jgi:hypothetical protein
MKKELEVRFSLLTEEQLERMVLVEPEKWGIKKELIAMCDCWGDALKVEKVSDCEFAASFDLDMPSDGVADMSSVVTFNYQVDEYEMIDVSGVLEYPEFDGIEDFVWGIEEEE